MIDISEMIVYLNNLLQVEQFNDYCPNGLQVSGKDKIKRIATSVSADLQSLEQAIAFKADVLLVHHGYFWKGEPAVITGIKRNRIQQLLKHQINLLAYHLPLDAHLTYGNNIQLANQLNIDWQGKFDIGDDIELGFYGELREPVSASALVSVIKKQLLRDPLWIDCGAKRPINKIGWCTGAGQDLIEKAAGFGLDAFISGEINERTTHLARELGIHYYCAGHHATERYGVKALGEHLAEKYDLSHQFIDVDNPA